MISADYNRNTVNLYYPTLSWDSSKIERICFAVISTDLALVPTQSEQEVTKFSKFANNAPYAYAGERRTLVYGLTHSLTRPARNTTSLGRTIKSAITSGSC
jgi:hypothetical protein